MYIRNCVRHIDKYFICNEIHIEKEREKQTGIVYVMNEFTKRLKKCAR